MVPPDTTPPPEDGNPAASGPADTGRWGRIPAWWLGHPDIDADGLAVLAALATYANARGECWPSQATLAAALKRSRSTVNRILGHLAEARVIEMEPRRSASGGRLSCLYRLRLVPGDGPIVAPAPATADRTAPAQGAARTGAGVGDGTVRPRDTAEILAVATADSPCAPVRQEQPGFEQTPDSLSAREPAREVPADWMPGADDLTWARARFSHIDLGRHVEGFLLRCRAHGYRYRDVGAAWRAWLVQDAAAGKAPPTRSAGSGAPVRTKAAVRPSEEAAEQRLGAWMAAAARLNATASQPWG